MENLIVDVFGPIPSVDVNEELAMQRMENRIVNVFGPMPSMNANEELAERLARLKLNSCTCPSLMSKHPKECPSSVIDDCCAYLRAAGGKMDTAWSPIETYKGTPAIAVVWDEYLGQQFARWSASSTKKWVLDLPLEMGEIEVNPIYWRLPGKPPSTGAFHDS